MSRRSSIALMLLADLHLILYLASGAVVAPHSGGVLMHGCYAILTSQGRTPIKYLGDPGGATPGSAAKTRPIIPETSPVELTVPRDIERFDPSSLFGGEKERPSC